MVRLLVGVAMLLAGASGAAGDDPPLRVGTFAVDASPPVGSPLAYDPTTEVVLPLSCRGVVLIGDGKPVVLCAVDWIGIGNGGQGAFREALARAAGTEPERVAVHTLHQHDAPACDFSTARLLAEHGVDPLEVLDVAFAREVITRASSAVKQATADARPVTHLGLGQAEVKEVASNRRILGTDGKVRATRWTACTDPDLRAEPAGTIDPVLRLISFWDGDRPIAALSYYATHPQSYYRTGGANPDFPGMARNQRQEATGVPHIHFNGAGGNIGAGKWNDGAHENRQILADRVADGMAQAWQDTRRTPIAARDLGWESIPVALPPAPHLDEARLLDVLDDDDATIRERYRAAGELAWLTRCEAGEAIDVSCLRLGKARVLHLPGELFVEYQLAAQRLRPDLFVAMAAYGDYAPGYIGTEVAYEQGGYETAPPSSLVAPSVEGVLLAAITSLLRDEPEASAEEPKVIPLWEGGAPGFEDRRGEEEIAQDYWIRNIHNPSLTVYLPPKDQANGTSVVICPGGGHRELVFGAEGEEPARFLNGLGVAAFVLKYRLAREPDSPYALPQHARDDGLRAMRLVRSRADEFGVDPDRIGLMGFSAGGEVASLVAFHPGAGDPDATDPVDRRSSRPDFLIEIYPGPIGLPETIPHNAPPAFLLVANDDRGASRVVAELFRKYREARRPVETHVFAEGGHGFNMGQRSRLESVRNWPRRLADWLHDRGLLAPAASPAEAP